MNLRQYDIVIINSSGGKDSLCSIYEMHRMAIEQNYPISKMVISHQDLGSAEWEGTKELCRQQAEMFGMKMYVSKRVDKDGKEESLLEYALRRGKWPSNKQRWCTSDFKRGPGGKIVTQLTKDMPRGTAVLYVFGFRKSESPSRNKKRRISLHKGLSTKLRTWADGKRMRKRRVTEYLPIHHWSDKKVWDTIKDNFLPYHRAYDLGMPRLSCVFCIFSPFDALVIAGINNSKLLQEYVDVEKEIGHTFKVDLSLVEVQQKIKEGYVPKHKITNWVM